MDIAFGPVPSRRLGRSLGLNNIPPKIRTYSCIYCQLGRTNKMSDRRREFYSPAAVIAAVLWRPRPERFWNEEKRSTFSRLCRMVSRPRCSLGDGDPRDPSCGTEDRGDQ